MKSFMICLCAVTMVTVILLRGSAMAQGAPTIAGCPIFPADNVWNTPIDHLPVDGNSSTYIATIGATTGLHPDFGTIWEGAPIGIPYNIAPGTQPQVSITFDYFEESDPGPYPIPPDAAIEGGEQSSGDRHILVLDADHCILYETFYGQVSAPTGHLELDAMTRVSTAMTRRIVPLGALVGDLPQQRLPVGLSSAPRVESDHGCVNVHLTAYQAMRPQGVHRKGMPQQCDASLGSGTSQIDDAALDRGAPLESPLSWKRPARRSRLDPRRCALATGQHGLGRLCVERLQRRVPNACPDFGLPTPIAAVNGGL
jgi:hypothetical protein